MKEHLHDRNTKYYIENVCPQFPDIQIIYIAEWTVSRFLITSTKNEETIWW